MQKPDLSSEDTKRVSELSDSQVQTAFQSPHFPLSCLFSTSRNILGDAILKDTLKPHPAHLSHPLILEWIREPADLPETGVGDLVISRLDSV